MNKKILIGSILAVALLTLVSFSNVVGYQSVKTTQEDIITSEYDFDECKDYLFETLVDISNNEDVRDIINSNQNPINHNSRFLMPNRKNLDLKVEHLDLLYNLGLKLIDRLGEDKVEELMETIGIDKPEFADELDTIVMSNGDLAERIFTLTELNNENMTLICLIINIIMVVSLFIKVNFVQMFIFNPIRYILDVLNLQSKMPLLWYFILWTISVPIISISMIPIFLLFNIFQCDYIDIPNP